MGQQVVNGAQLQCSFGAAPSALVITPTGQVNASKAPAATIMDNVAMMNIVPFGLCSAPSNPQVAAATAAAGGVLTPQPCIPVVSAPWVPGSPTVLIAKKPALNSSSTCMCAWAGMITIVTPGQFTVNVP
jgi:hypothetical protein